MLESWFNSAGDNEGATVSRSPERQSVVDQQTANFALYHYESCWFCGKVRRSIEALGLNIELRNIQTDENNYRELITRGGRSTVPCLRIDSPSGEQWMYESADIIAFLNSKFGPEQPAS